MICYVFSSSLVCRPLASALYDNLRARRVVVKEPLLAEDSGFNTKVIDNLLDKVRLEARSKGLSILHVVGALSTHILIMLMYDLVVLLWQPYFKYTM